MRLRSARNVPIVGGLLHRFSHWLLPPGQRLWTQVQTGLAAGIWMELDPRAAQMHWQGKDEALVLKTLAENLRAGMVFYDLGANMGYYSLFAARQLDSSGHVFSFEPDVEIAEQLWRNVVKNGFSRITVSGAAVWSQSGTAKFIPADASSPGPGTGHLAAPDDPRRGFEVPRVTLDEFAETSPPPDIIKCDVEGAEVEVFRGAHKTLSAHHPFILCEIHSGENRRALLELLLPYGYSAEPLGENHLAFRPRA